MAALWWQQSRCNNYWTHQESVAWRLCYALLEQPQPRVISQGNKQAATTDQQKIFSRDGNEFLAIHIRLWSFHTLLVDSRESSLSYAFQKKEWGHIATRSSCVLRQREPWLLVVIDHTAHCYTVKPKLTPKEWENTGAHSVLTSEIVLLTKSLVGIQSQARVLPFREKISSTQRKLKLRETFIVGTQNLLNPRWS